MVTHQALKNLSQVQVEQWLALETVAQQLLLLQVQ
jgi:hypothetical protein